MKRSGGLFPAMILMGVALAGCGLQGGTPTSTLPVGIPVPPSVEATSPPAVSPSATAPSITAPSTTRPSTTTAPSTTSPSTSTAPRASLKTFTTADGQLAFDYPEAWSVRDPAGELPEGGGAFAEVTNKAGKPLATLRTNMATGSTCQEKYPYEVLELQELPVLTRNGAKPRFVFETRGDAEAAGPAETPAAAYGITTVPAATGDSACPIFHFFTWPPTAAMFGAFFNPDNNVVPGAAGLPYLEQARKYMDTTEYQDIRRMITSLRPAAPMPSSIPPSPSAAATNN
ncbi:hypothetical protein ASF72_12880 [Arthrobacter sp. Leaf141]|nr:hypothetical protein ASF72_12880 [Arthrobacter sp. Leaf141]